VVDMANVIVKVGVVVRVEAVEHAAAAAVAAAMSVLSLVTNPTAPFGCGPAHKWLLAEERRAPLRAQQHLCLLCLKWQSASA
jgi:hypothetical protein